LAISVSETTEKIETRRLRCEGNFVWNFRDRPSS